MQHTAKDDFDGPGVKELADWLSVIDHLAVHLHEITLDIHRFHLKVPTRMDPFSDEDSWSDVPRMTSRLSDNE